MTLADLFQLVGLGQDGLVGWSVVESSTRNGSGGQDSTVVYTAEHEPDATLLADRKQFVQRFLLEKCVASSQQTQIGVGGLDRFGHQAGLVDAKPNRFDDLLIP